MRFEDQALADEVQRSVFYFPVCLLACDVLLGLYITCTTPSQCLGGQRLASGYGERGSLETDFHLYKANAEILF